MKAIQGGKAKTDKIAAPKLAVLLRGGRLPQAYVYPAERRATRDRLRRRCPLGRQRAELLAHLHNTTSQYNLPESGKKLASKANREGVEEHFPAPSVRKTLEGDGSRIAHYDQLLGEGELSITPTAKAHDGQTFSRFQSVPGSGQLLALVLLSEIQDSARFPRVPDFVSSCRVGKCATESNGKRLGTAGKKIGTGHLHWAVAEAGVLFLGHTQPGKEYVTKLAHQPGKATALTVLAHQLARAVYDLLSRQPAVALQRVVAA
jgi:transposase